MTDILTLCRCSQCNEPVESGFEFVNKHMGKIEEAFCSEECKDEWEIDNGQFGAGA